MTPNKNFGFPIIVLAILIGNVPAQEISWSVTVDDVFEEHTQEIKTETEWPETSPTTPIVEEGQVQSRKPEVEWIKIKSRVQFRYATTNIQTRISNTWDQPQPVGFLLNLPEDAFITSFELEKSGKIYPARVKKREEAEIEYLESMEKGYTAAHVSQSERDQSRFGIAINLSPNTTMGFNITYEELLPRRKGIYHQIISLRPEQMKAKYIKAEIYVIEASNITKLNVEGLGIEMNLENNTEFTNEVRGEVNLLSPTGAYIKLIAFDGIQTQEHQLIHLEYDIDRTQPEVLLMDGYFVHFMPAPNEASPLPKHIIFVLDTSASMWGIKIQQLRDAMLSILTKLRPEDYFTIITFNSDVKLWTPRQVEVVGLTKYPVVHSASENNLSKAKEYLATLEADGGTNIFEAIRRGLQVAARREQGGPDLVQPIVFFLTDGVPTVGELSLLRILVSARAINTEIQASIFALAFGDNAKFRFLQKLSVQNHGWARRIYESADAVLQLESVFDEIQSPVLVNATFVYVQKVDHVTKNKFHGIFLGGEAVVAGHLSQDEITLVGEVMASGKQGLELFTQRSQELRGPPGETGVLERFWAYLTIRQELDLEANENDPNATEEHEKRALEIALKYGFVTPVTSLLVVLPDLNATRSTAALSIGEYTDETKINSQGAEQEISNPHKIISEIKPFFKPLPVGPFAELANNNRKRLSLSDITWLSKHKSTSGNHLIIQDEEGNFQEYLLENMNQNSTDLEFLDGERCATPLKDSGRCLPLFRCVQSAFVRDYNEFLKYFCSRPDKLAGVCCPDNF